MFQARQGEVPSLSGRIPIDSTHLSSTACLSASTGSGAGIQWDLSEISRDLMEASPAAGALWVPLHNTGKCGMARQQQAAKQNAPPPEWIDFKSLRTETNLS